MIDRTFIHLPGIGPTRERLLWGRGISSWDIFESQLRLGVLPRGLFSSNGNLQLRLFPDAVDASSRNGKEPHLPGGTADPRVETWLENITRSRKALREEDYSFFLECLNPSDHWRVLAGLINDALYLDIETTGLSIDLNYVTVIGALYRNKFYQWVWPEPLDDLIELMKKARLVVTFNGRRFDIPFTRHWASTVPTPQAHIDLLYIARSLGLDGGLKAIERHFDLVRDESIEGVDGAEAVVMWCKALWGDKRAYKQLLLYNKTDVEMLPKLAARLCHEHIKKTLGDYDDEAITSHLRTRFGHKPAQFLSLRHAWESRRSGLHLLTPKLQERFGREPIVVGIDLRGNPKNPTGWSRCQGSKAESRILYNDDEIFALTLSARPDIVSIDAPLSLPRGRVSVSDDSPCREKGGIVRDAERILWARGIPVYPSLIRHMQGLTQRGINLADRLRESGIAVIESYPGAAQDILGIPRKRIDLDILRRGLQEFGFETSDEWSHDELDALTSALVGYFYLADEYEAIGADDEGYMIIPRWTAAMRWTEGNSNSSELRRAICILGGSDLLRRNLSHALAQRLGWRCLDIASICPNMISDQQESIAKNGVEVKLLESRSLPAELEGQANRTPNIQGLILEEFPQNTGEVQLAWHLWDYWSVIHLKSADISVATSCADGLVNPSSASLRLGCSCEVCTVNRLITLIKDVEVIELATTRSMHDLVDDAVQKLLSTTLK